MRPAAFAKSDAMGQTRSGEADDLYVQSSGFIGEAGEHTRPMTNCPLLLPARGGRQGWTDGPLTDGSSGTSYRGRWTG